MYVNTITIQAIPNFEKIAATKNLMVIKFALISSIKHVDYVKK